MLQHLPSDEGQLKREPIVCIREVSAGELGDPSEPLPNGIAV
jgi:hypothetical protein